MSEDRSPRLGLPLLATGQAQKEITHNEALQALDALVQPVAASADRAEPPTVVADGECWIVPQGATGAWAGRETMVAQWTAGGWRFITPRIGWRYHLCDRSEGVIFDGLGWRREVIRTDGVYIDGIRIVGPRKILLQMP